MGDIKHEPYGYAFQHEETGLEQVIDVQQVEWGFEKNNPRWQKIGAVYPESALAAKDVEIAKLREALTKAADQLDRVHDDAFKQAGGYGLSAADGRSFSCFELNQCSTAAHAARAALKGGEA